MTQSSVERFALTVTRGIGSPASIIVHTIIFAACFASAFFGFIEWQTMLLVLTTIVSLEAIYLSIFIQMTINYTSEAIEEVSEDVGEIQEDIDEIQEDVDEIQEDVDEIQEDIEEVQEDVDELQEDVEDISEDVEEMTEEEKEDEARKVAQRDVLSAIQTDLQKLLADVERLKNPKSKK